MSSFANLKRQSGNLDKLAKAVEALSSSSEGSEKVDNFWKASVDKSGNGMATIRFLPAPGQDGDDSLPWVKIFSHGFQGPTGKWYIENSLTTIGENDPVGELNTQLWNSGSEANKEIARKQKRKLSFIANIYVVSDPKHPENEGKVFLFKFGKKIFDKISEAMNPQFEDEEAFNPFDMWNGANFKLKIRKVEGYQNYDKSEFESTGPLAEDSELENIWKSEHSIKELLDDKEFKSYNKLKERLDKILGISDDAPVAKFVTVVRDFVVAANIDSGATGSYRVQWSGFGDETTWTSSQITQSDYQDIPDGGHITGIRGGEFGLILMEKAIHRMTYIGTPLIFQFDNISREKGCIAAGSISQYQGLTFFLSDDGFYLCDGQQVVPIGAEKVDRYFFSDADPDFTTMSCAVDPVRKLVLWNYKSRFAERKLLVYSFTTKKWAVMQTTADYISDATTASVTIEELDSISSSLDALSVSLDSNLYVGGKYFLGGTTGTQVVTFNGASKTASIETGDVSTGGRSMVTLAKPQVDNGSASVALASRALLSDQVTFGTSYAADSDNRVSIRGSGNYHRLKVTPTGDNWKMAVAVDIDVIPQGSR